MMQSVRTAEPAATQAPLQAPRLRAILVGALLVVALAFLIPYFNYTLGKFDWAFRPLCVGPIFLLMVLLWPINPLLRRIRPSLAFTTSELLLMYAMMAICGALASEGLFGYVMVDTVHPQYYASRENRWATLFMPSIPTWLQITDGNAVRWFYETAPEGAAYPYVEWIRPILSWSLFALALYTAFFCLASLFRKDWIEGQRLTFPFAAVPIELAGAAGETQRPILKNPVLWAGVALPVVQSLFQMAHAFWPAVPYTPMYWQLGRFLNASGPLSSIQYTFAYVGFETIGILALLPAEVSLSLWLFFVLNRVQVITFALLGFGQEGIGAAVFSPSAFIMYQEVGAAVMLALILLWQSRKTIGYAFGRLIGKPAPEDPMDPISPRGAALGLILSCLVLCIWASRAGMSLWSFIALMGIFFGYSIAMCRLVAAGGVYVPQVTMGPRDLLVGFTGTGGFSTTSLTMVTLLEQTFMQQGKVNFLHYAVNDLKVTHTARIPGWIVGVSLLLAVVLMMAVTPWVGIHAAYDRGALLFDSWQFRDSGNGIFGQLADALKSPESATPFLTLGLLCGAAMMLFLTWMHQSFLWWGLSPIGFIMGGGNAMNTRIWTNAFLAWLAVVAIRRFGGLKLYARCRPAFLGMVLGHFLIMALRSMIDPMLGLNMQLSPWA